MAPRRPEESHHGPRKGQDGRKTAKTEKHLFLDLRFVQRVYAKRSFLNKTKNVPATRETLLPEPRGGGRGRGKPFPEGERRGC